MPVIYAEAERAGAGPQADGKEAAWDVERVSSLLEGLSRWDH